MQELILQAGYSEAFGALTDQLKATGIPFLGWSVRPAAQDENPHLTISGRPYFVELIYSQETTGDQRRDLRQVVRNFSFERRRPKNRADLRQALNGLPDADFKDLVVELLVNEIRGGSRFASRLGKLIEGDEKDDSFNVKHR